MTMNAPKIHVEKQEDGTDIFHIDVGEISSEEVEKYLGEFVKHFEGKMIDTPADIQKIIDENFWNLL